MSALAGFVQRTDFWWRLKRTLLIFWAPLVGTAVMLAVIAALASFWEKPDLAPLPALPPPEARPTIPSSDPVRSVSDPTYWASQPGISIPGVMPSAALVRGTIEKADGNTLLVKTREGGEVTVKLAENVRVNGIVKAQLGDIKQNSFVGITAMPQPDGTQKALEVHIFPEARRNAGEGHRPWEPVPNSTMTNANVEQFVTAVDGPMLTMKYKDGEKKISVPTNATIVAFVNGDRSELKPGAKIFIAAGTKNPDGTIGAATISVGRDGFTPPM